jgi:phage portal protein BeeE
MGALVRYIEKRTKPQTTPDKVPSQSATAYAMRNDRGRVGKTNVQLLRSWAENSEWVRAAINVRKTQISSAEWGIVPAKPEGANDINLTMQKRLTDLFEQPNARSDSFRNFIEPVIEDILVLDAGTIEKVRTVRGEVAELWPVDGGTIRVNALWDGDPDEPRYFWYPDWQERASFKNDELLYIMMNPRSYSVLGVSPLETLKLTIDAELNSSEYSRRQVTEAAPDGLLHLGEGARPEDIDRFKSYWEMEVAGKGALGILGGTKAPAFIQFRNTNRDMQFLEWNIYLVRKIAAVFGLSPMDLGLTFDVNRATSEVQMQQTEDRGLRPLMALIQEYMTREIVWDEAYGGKENGLAFRFLALNLKETKAKADINKSALAGFPWKTPNEARIDDGREPLGSEYDDLFMVTPTGAVRLADVPTAREVLEAQKAPKPSDDGQQKPAGQTSPGGKN